MATALPWWSAGGAVLLLDFGSKHLVRERLVEGDILALAPFFNLVFFRNSGAAFSLLADAGGWQRYFFVCLAALVALTLSYLLTLKHDRTESFAYSMILGGALGNALDRLAFGPVTDFLDLHWAGWHWPAFNIADIGIVVGAACLFARALRASANDA
ncbi:lipoprotein signal peptidase [Ramlibacter sp. AW1]|uniref:Lipoprotein signal peptidase n=1 Tax=Ramlibacter aurantiacus TaxID=2801330 RepID=A0A937D7Z7_9BURK|nr:lipoprotein signal peptidase [Ramlibacter aurantiacus]